MTAFLFNPFGKTIEDPALFLDIGDNPVIGCPKVIVEIRKAFGVVEPQDNQPRRFPIDRTGKAQLALLTHGVRGQDEVDLARRVSPEAIVVLAGLAPGAGKSLPV